MPKTLLFVHGTGVRSAAYAATAALIERQLTHHRLGSIRFEPCLWGDRFGAKLALDGQSIPGYGKTRSAEHDIEDQSRALWDLLMKDPTFELASLAGQQASASIGPPNALAGLNDLLGKFSDLGSNADFRVELTDMGLDHFVEARRVNAPVRELIAVLAASDGFQACARAAVAGKPEHRSALARALAAGLQRMAVDEGIPALDAAHRDELVMRIEHLLADTGGGVVAAALAPLKGLGSAFATWRARRERTSLSDAAYPAAGDILLYQVHGQRLRDFLRERIAAFPDDEVYVLAHSLGGVAMVETLIEHDLPNVKRLITFGSQAPFFYEIGALATLPFGEDFPPHFPWWSNFYDLNDPLSYIGEQVFKGRVLDYPIESGESFPVSHSAYLSSKLFWTQLSALINDA
jgi:hypothetical protein